jgi:hypothetical protein
MSTGRRFGPSTGDTAVGVIVCGPGCGKSVEAES